MKIGIMGLGFVGSAMKKILESKYEVYCYDPAKEGYQNSEVLKEAEIIFVCVGTPMKEDGSVNLDYINSACEIINDLKTNPIVVIKSTVPPGTCDELADKYNLQIGSNPEFLRERYALRDMWTSDRLILGGTSEIRKKIKEVYYPIFGDDIVYIELTNKEAEMVKHVTNAFLASQVGFANEIYNICNILGINYDNIKRAIYFDKRLGRHIAVPGTDGKLGFGGHCLPKDLNGLIWYSKKKGYNPELLQKLWDFNVKQRGSET
jgi:UDPglucose 6-dehydrogenase